MRRSLLRIWIGTSVILLGFLGLTTYPEVDRARRYEAAQFAMSRLPKAERLEVLDRIAWLNGQAAMPSVPPVGNSDPSQQLRNGIDIATAQLAAARPLPAELEDLARDANVAPRWEVIRWRAGLFIGAIAALWGLLLLGFWMTGEHRSSARQGV